MPWPLLIFLYRLLLPVFFLAAFPGWLVKMARRGGFGTGLLERLGVYTHPPEFDPYGAVHVHAISVGECLLATKLIKAWQMRDPAARFVLATGTATGHHVATAAALPRTRVTYSPLDFRWMLRAYFRRFAPAQIVLIEGEAWPNLLSLASSRHIPVSLVNARMSPRSKQRYASFAPSLRPMFSQLSLVATQEAEDRDIWQKLGVPPARIFHAGSLKFDPANAPLPSHREDFQAMIDAFGQGRKVILAASTHDGEETLIAQAIATHPENPLAAIVPRHAERRDEICKSLAKAGLTPVQRTRWPEQSHLASEANACLIIDTTGELRDWTAHADAIVIGKSFLATGGQNPAEAILARKPVVHGPHMENFQPLVATLVANHATLATTADALPTALAQVLTPSFADSLTTSALRILATHQGATQRILDALIFTAKPAA